MESWHLLSLATLWPIAAALLVWTFPAGEGRGARGLALAASLVELALVVAACVGFAPADGGFQLAEQVAWMPSFGVHWALAVDGWSLLMVVLTSVLTPIALLASFDDVRSKGRDYVACILLLEGALVGGFAARDLFAFYVFWEAMLVPAYFLVGAWGKERSGRATLRFFLYTMTGSMVMLIALVAAASIGHVGEAPSFLLADMATQLAQADLGVAERLLFFGFAIAFLIKVPLLPLHGWMPETYSEAPASSLVLISGVMVKLGALSFLRFAWLLFPRAATEFAPIVLSLAVAGCLYAAWLAAGQSRLRRVFAYSSMSHMGLCVLAMVAMTPLSLTGCMVQMFHHGINVAALFLLVGMLERRCRSDHFSDLGGLASEVPHLSTCLVIAALASIGLPGLNGFVGEFLLLTGSFASEGLGVGVSQGAFAQAGIVLLLTMGALFVLRAGYALWALAGPAWQSNGGRALRTGAGLALLAGTLSLVWLPTGELPGGLLMGLLVPYANSQSWLLTGLPMAVCFAVTSVVLAAVYMLRGLERTLFGPPATGRPEVHDLTLRECLCVYPLVASMIFFGLWPRPIVALAEPAATAMARAFREGAGWPAAEPLPTMPATGAGGKRSG